MARIRSTWPSTVRACRAEIEPIETWSSWFALVGIESTEAGMGEDLVLGDEGGRRVLVDHHPRVDPGRRRQERRQPAVQVRIHEQRGPSLADRPELRQGDLGEVERQRDRLAVEVAAADHPAAAGRDGVLVGDPAAREDERVVGRRVELDVEDAPEVVERVPHGAVDLRDAAQRIRVLDLVGVAVVAGLEPAVAEQMTKLGGDRDLARCGRASW